MWRLVILLPFVTGTNTELEIPDTGTNGDFEIFYYWDTGTNVNLRDFLSQPWDKCVLQIFPQLGPMLDLMKNLYIFDSLVKYQPLSLTKIKVFFYSISFTKHCHDFTNSATVS